MQLIAVREAGPYALRAAQYIHSKWGKPDNYPLYEQSICGCVGSAAPLPHWFVLEEAGELLGCAGLVQRDFIVDREESPWLCCLFVEPALRGRGMAGRLIGAVEEAARASGFSSLYLCTEHTAFYERYGFVYDGNGTYENGAIERIYTKRLAN